jgi:hypothetical protein
MRSAPTPKLEGNTDSVARGVPSDRFRLAYTTETYCRNPLNEV